MGSNAPLSFCALPNGWGGAEQAGYTWETAGAVDRAWSTPEKLVTSKFGIGASAAAIAICSKEVRLQDRLPSRLLRISGALPPFFQIDPLVETDLEHPR